jgi:DtxR family Mn-dependent transcriptional regulator
MKLSKSLEDYLEVIYVLKTKKGVVRVKDIASRFNFSPPSVTETIKKLAGRNLVNYKKYSQIELTPSGENVAKNIYEKHKLLAEFFMHLGVDEETALHDACLAEHILSRKTLNRIKEFNMVNS